jgi:hypothetical protein
MEQQQTVETVRCRGSMHPSAADSTTAGDCKQQPGRCIDRALRVPHDGAACMCSAAQRSALSAVQRVALAPQCSALQRSAAHGSAAQRSACLQEEEEEGGGGILCTFQLAGLTKAASSSRRTRRPPSLPHDQPAPQRSVRTRAVGVDNGDHCQCAARCAVQHSAAQCSAFKRTAAQGSAVQSLPESQPCASAHA